MVFSSVMFVLVFLPITICIYLLLYYTGKKLNLFSFSNFFLLFISLFFYAWGEYKYVLLLIFSGLVNFYVGLLLRHCTTKGKGILFFAISINLSLLCYYKYMNFLVENGLFQFINFLLPLSMNITTFSQIALPLGISFFTFQGMSYIIDVYRDKNIATSNFIDFACYLTMFPQLAAGPIVRYASIAEELKARVITTNSFADGAQRFIVGLAKKLFIADTLGRVATAAFSIPATELSPLAAWAGAICYTLQIYYDFSGYSDMAIGLGCMFGFTFPENFNYPYVSRSIQEFWRRWHITLSTWFRDYLYIPLGGNRLGLIRTSFNLMLVFMLCGFWHGASWVFLFWGIYHGIFLIIERLFPNFPSCLPVFLQHSYALLVVILGWVLFSAHNVQHALGYIKGMFGAYEEGILTNRVWVEFFAGDVYLALLFGVLFSFPVLKFCSKKWNAFQQKNTRWASSAEAIRLGGVLLLFLALLMPLFGSTFKAFIYFRF